MLIANFLRFSENIKTFFLMLVNSKIIEFNYCKISNLTMAVSYDVRLNFSNKKGEKEG